MEGGDALRQPTLHERLVPVDELGKRWARWGEDRPSLHPLEAMRLLHDGAVLGGGSKLMPDDIRAFDEVLCAAPEEKNALLKLWYMKRHLTSAQIADRLRISRSSLYIYRNDALWYMLGALNTKGVKL